MATFIKVQQSSEISGSVRAAQQAVPIVPHRRGCLPRGRSALVDAPDPVVHGSAVAGRGRGDSLAFLLAIWWRFAPAGGCKQGAWPLWNAYAAHFIDGQGRVIDHTERRPHHVGRVRPMRCSSRWPTTTAPPFDHLLAWTQANLANNDLGHPPARVAVGQGQRRAMEDARPKLSLGCRCLDGLHAA
jgi:hypothetical protein